MRLVAPTLKFTDDGLLDKVRDTLDGLMDTVRKAIDRGDATADKERLIKAVAAFKAVWVK